MLIKIEVVEIKVPINAFSIEVAVNQTLIYVSSDRTFKGVIQSHYVLVMGSRCPSSNSRRSV
jgi:hypothetical protein